MAQSGRGELVAEIEAKVRELVSATGLTAELEVQVFFEDELLFVSATRRDPDGAVLWRSSHAASPDSGSLSALREAGDELVTRVAADAALAAAVDGGADD